MTSRALQVHSMSVNEVRNIAVDMQGKLDTGETLTGTPAVTEQTTTDLTITNKAVNTAALTINRTSVAIGKAIQFTVDPAAESDGRYTIYFSCSTSAGQTVDGEVVILISDH